MRKAALTLLLAALAVSAAAQQHPNQKKGFNAENVYAVHDIDVVNAFNGNVTVSIPIGPTYPIADGLSYGLVLHGNSNLWDSVLDEGDVGYNPSATTGGGPSAEFVDQCDELNGITVAVPHRRANAGLGWILTMGRVFPPSDRTAGNQWTYESPDGADHPFHETLHEPPTSEPANDNVLYTRDGTYLRMRLNGDGTLSIEFPDGSVHKFQAPAGEGAWMPIEIRNRFTPNFLTINYNSTPTIAGGKDWVLTDSHGRTQKVIFASKEWNGSTRFMVDRVELMAFGTDANGTVTPKTATYQFNYTTRFIGRTDWSERCEAFMGTVAVQTLDSIVFPDDPTTGIEGTTSYQFGYMTSTSWQDTNGLLQYAILPTGAMIRWDLALYNKPNESADTPQLSTSWGVIRRKLYAHPNDFASNVPPIATWTYTPTLDDNYIDEGDGDNDFFPREMTNTITDPLGNVTVHYFSVSWSEPSPNPFWSGEDYGRPFTRHHSLTRPAGDKVWLSSVSYPPAVTIDPDDPLRNALKATYVRYERDVSSGSLSDRNWRLASSRTVWPGPGPNPQIIDFVDTDHTNFDGLGHYRTTKVSGFGSASKTTTTNYNPTRGQFPGSFVMVPTSTNWVLNTYDFTEVKQGTVTARADYCFDTNTGFLKQKLVQRGLEPRFDLLAVYKDTNNDGNVDVEEYSGGQQDPLPDWAGICGPNVFPRYTLNHTYSHGVRASTQHSSSNFKSLDLIIDPTGVASGSRDPSGTLTTRYVYNPMGQLRAVHPNRDAQQASAEAWTEYLYNINPLVNPRASVTVKQRSPSNGTVLTETRHYYDVLGRMVQQRTATGTTQVDGWPWVASSVTYDALGRRTTASVPMGVSSGSWGTITPPGNTQWFYDGLGRTKKVIQPDGSATDIVYTGASEVARTAKIATTTTGSANVTTLEVFDVLGRLEQVTEDSTGAAIPTLYEYDEGDRLKKVIAGVQTRIFDYDRAGLLRLEDHPESDPTTYEYDARGHVTRRVTNGSRLRFDYDAAERLTKVWHDPDDAGPSSELVMKEFTFGASGISRGRPVTAKRHNYHPDLGGSGDVTVTETFSYETATGRLSSKITAVGVPNKPLRTFDDSYTYDELGATKTITYPGCSSCGSAPARTVENFYQRGYLQSVDGYATGILYHANGMWAQFSRPNANGSTGPMDIQTIALHGMARPESLSVTGHCTGFTIGALPATKTVAAGAGAGLSITAPAGSTYQWFNGDTTIPGQTSSTLNVPVNATTTFWVRVANGDCTIDSNESVVTVNNTCVGPTISAPSSIKIGTSGTASVAEAGAYAWTIQNGTITSATNGQSVAFTAGCSGPVTLNVTFTPACGGGPRPGSKDIPVTAPSVQLSASPASISQSGSSTLTVTVSPTGPWSIKWADLPNPIDVTTSAQRSVTPVRTTTYEVQQVNGCAIGQPWASTTVTVIPPAPVTTTATRTSATSVLVSWTPPGGATIDSYRVERCTTSCASPSNWQLVATPSALSFHDAPIASSAAYVYRVFSVTSGTQSTSSGPRDFATTFTFTDDPLTVPGGQSAIHVSQLRAAVDALRVAAGLGAFNYTDTMSAGSPLKALYLTQLQTAVNEARAAFNAAGVTFTLPAPAAGNLPLAAHIHELRGGVQ